MITKQTIKNCKNIQELHCLFESVTPAKLELTTNSKGRPCVNISEESKITVKTILKKAKELFHEHGLHTDEDYTAFDSILGRITPALDNYRLAATFTDTISSSQPGSSTELPLSLRDFLEGDRRAREILLRQRVEIISAQKAQQLSLEDAYSTYTSPNSIDAPPIEIDPQEELTQQLSLEDAYSTFKSPYSIDAPPIEIDPQEELIQQLALEEIYSTYKSPNSIDEFHTVLDPTKELNYDLGHTSGNNIPFSSSK